MLGFLLNPLGLLGSISTIAAGALGVALLLERANNTTLKANITELEVTIQNTRAQNVELQNAVETTNALMVQMREQLSLSDQVAQQARERIDDLESDLDDLEGDLKSVAESDDGPAAPILEFTARGMRHFFATTGLVRAGDNPAAGVAGNQDRPSITNPSEATTGP